MNVPGPELPPSFPGADLPAHRREERILIQGLALKCHIGVPEEERAEPQVLLLDLSLEPQSSFAAMGDAIDSTVDYAKLAAELVALAASKPRLLLETLADDLARWVFQHYPAQSLSLRIRKFILPETEFVGVSLSWSRNTKSPAFP